MDSTLTAAVVIAGIAVSGFGLLIVFGILILAFAALFFFWWRRYAGRSGSRASTKPDFIARPTHWWESEAVFNPAAFVLDNKVHLLYRAMGGDGISRIGYASSDDGIHFERLPYPVYAPDRGFGIPRVDRVYGPLSYSQTSYASGGGWGGVEDPRIVKIDERAYMTFVAFDGWGFVRMALTSMPLPDFSQKNWQWKPAAFLSPPGEIHKNWVLFPEKCAASTQYFTASRRSWRSSMSTRLKAFDDEDTYIHGSTRAGGGPSIGTKWCAVPERLRSKHPRDGSFSITVWIPITLHVGYKVGAMLLDLDDPTKVLIDQTTRSSPPRPGTKMIGSRASL
jgi:predicted GH43/DUF377 family glycosyl hydrolase